MKKLLLILIFCVINGSEQCPNIVSRASWGSRQTVTSPIVSVRPPPLVIVHHSAGAACSNRNECNAQMRVFQNFHMDVRGWNDIGYNFCIGGNGEIFEGRGWSRQGAHAPSFNSRSTGICFIGNFDKSAPTQAAINAYHALVDCGVRTNQISRNYSLLGHRQVDPNPNICPGQALYDLMVRWPNWVQNPPSN